MKKTKVKMQLKTRKNAIIENEKAITLIALIVTIIVLLILAGVSIATLTGENGILTRAQEAKNKTEEAALEEKIQLLAAETVINQYTGENEEKTAEELQKELNEQGENVLVIQWDKYIIFDLNKNEEYRVMSDGSAKYWGESTMGQTLLNAKTANADQISQDPSSSNLIGIDNEGNTVNMLLWEYTLIDDTSLGKEGTYGLNDKNGLDGSGTAGRSAGYIGDYTEDGKIIGTVPAYISEDSGNTYISVTSMAHTFYDCDELIIAPEIADTVTNMQVTFYQSSNLTTAPSKIPDSVTNASFTFSDCNKLNTIPILGNNIKDMNATFRNTALTVFDEGLPDSVINMQDTFYGCASLAEFNVEIPNNVKKLTNMFSNCALLTIVPSVIPDSVTDMTRTFMNCTSLKTGPSIIPNSVINMDSTFYNCTSLVTGPTTVSSNVTNMKSTFYNCESLTTLPNTIPTSVTNMLQTFSNCSKVQGEIEINANIDESIVFEWNGNQYKGYDQTFLNAATESNGIIVKNTSTCREEILNTWVTSNSNITLEE